MPAAVATLFPEPEPKPKAQPAVFTTWELGELERLGPKASQHDIVAGLIFVVAESALAYGISYSNWCRGETAQTIERSQALLLAAIAKRDAERAALAKRSEVLAEQVSVLEARLALLETRQ